MLHQEQLAPRTRPSLDAQAAEEMSRLLSNSMMLGDRVTITLFHEHDDIRYTGQVLPAGPSCPDPQTTDGRWVPGYSDEPHYRCGPSQ
ncbi:YolD-like family protein [Paenibacillus amylolyticus]|nr:YolD-like family protein [Paenibacillus amylolyticus]